MMKRFNVYRTIIDTVIKKILLVICAIVIILIPGEIAVKNIRPQITFSQAFRDPFDCLIDDPELPFTLKKNFTCEVNLYGLNKKVPIHTNSLGYRGPEFTVNKKPGTKRILVLGDSFTLGLGVEDNETYPYKMQQILREKGYGNAEVINAGYADGYSPDSYYVYLKNRGMQLRPDIIILSFFTYDDIADLTETVWEKTDISGLPEKIVSCCRLWGNGYLINKNLPVKYRIPILRNSQLFQFSFDTFNSRFKIFADTSIDPPKRDRKKGCEMNPDCFKNYYAEDGKVRQLLKSIKKLADENHSKLLTVLIPIQYQVYPETANGFWNAVPLDTSQPDFMQKHMSEFFISQKMDYLDLLPVLSENKSRGYLFTPTDVHLNDLGNTVAAEAIDDFLINRYLPD